VVNMFNPLNYDIDLDLPDDFPHQHLITNRYTYQELPNPTVKEGTTYRCRLIGILRRRNILPHDEFHASSRSLTCSLARLNNWVLVTILGTDKFNRMLVELVDFVSGTSLNDELRSNRSVYTGYT
jgi:hypothetical protein